MYSYGDDANTNQDSLDYMELVVKDYLKRIVFVNYFASNNLHYKNKV